LIRGELVLNDVCGRVQTMGSLRLSVRVRFIVGKDRQWLGAAGIDE